MKRRLGVILFVSGAVTILNCFLYLAVFIWPHYENATPEAYFKMVPLTNRVAAIGAIGLVAALVGMVLALIELASRLFRRHSTKD
jgi:hypothetical protein